MAFSYQKLAFLLAIGFSTIYIRFYALGNLFLKTTTGSPTLTSNDNSVESKVVLTDQAPSHSTTPPIKLVFFFLPMPSNQTDTTDQRNIPSEHGFIAARNHPSGASSHPHGSKDNPDEYVTSNVVDSQIDVPHNGSAGPFLYGARPFQAYRQYTSDYGTAWWLWFVYFLSKMISSVGKKRVTAMMLRDKLSVLLPNFLFVAWICAHVVCLILRPLWIIIALVIPLGGIALIWKDVMRIGRKLSLPPTQERSSRIPIIDLFNGALVGLFVILLPSILFRAIAVLYSFSGLYPWMRKLFRTYSKKAKSKFILYTKKAKTSFSLHQTQPRKGAKSSSSARLNKPHKVT